MKCKVQNQEGGDEHEPQGEEHEQDDHHDGDDGAG